MILAVDVGNTSIELALLHTENGSIKAKFRYSAKAQKTIRYHKDHIREFVKNSNVSGIVITSVVPEISEFLNQVCDELFNLQPLFVNSDIKTGLAIKYDYPEKLGADLISAASGAAVKYGSPVIVIDVGTATTFSVVNDKNEYLGGLIAPGPVTSMKALASMTAQLPAVRLKITDKVIGTNTSDCINIGTVTAHCAMIDGMLERVKESLGCSDVKVIATGGFSKDLIPLCRQNMLYDENLIFTGLYQIYKMNMK